MLCESKATLPISNFYINTFIIVLFVHIGNDFRKYQGGKGHSYLLTNKSMNTFNVFEYDWMSTQWG